MCTRELRGKSICRQSSRTTVPYCQSRQASFFAQNLYLSLDCYYQHIILILVLQYKLIFFYKVFCISFDNSIFQLGYSLFSFVFMQSQIGQGLCCLSTLKVIKPCALWMANIYKCKPKFDFFLMKMVCLIQIVCKIKFTNKLINQ